METNNAKVLRARLMDQPEDFRKLGINPAKVEKWEDGRRTKTEEVGSEIWYFSARGPACSHSVTTTSSNFSAITSVENARWMRISPIWEASMWLGMCHGSAIITAAVSMAFVGFVEELVFRGFLFKAMLKDGNVAMAIIVSSVTFGLGHIFSLFTGDSFIESLTGIVVAITMGFVLTMVFFKCGSLIPCIIAHCVIYCSFSIRHYSDVCRSGSSSEVLTAKGKLKRVLSDYHLSYARLDRASLYPYCERGPFYVFPGL